MNPRTRAAMFVATLAAVGVPFGHFEAPLPPPKAPTIADLEQLRRADEKRERKKQLRAARAT